MSQQNVKLMDKLDNYIWIELIGFDNEMEDFGVANYLKNIGFTPKGVALLLTAVDFVNMHKSMDEEYFLEDDYCSYSGHPYNPERARQKWSNYEVRGLVSELKKYGIDVYLSFFDFLGEHVSLADEHPELRPCYYNNGVPTIRKLINMIKRFSDGTYYEDFFLKQLLLVAEDFGFNGIHLADGIVRPRYPVQSGDFSDDVIEQSQIEIPEGEIKHEYILKYKRKEWLDFYTKRWSAFLQKIITGLKAKGLKVITNSAWPKDPVESIFRYGVDYKVLENCGFDGFIAENGAPTIALLDDHSNAMCHYTHEDRKRIHHYFSANLVTDCAYISKSKIIPLYPLQDTLEQYDVIHHLPPSLERHTSCMMNFYYVNEDKKFVPIVDGHTFCLGDGLAHADWEGVTKYIENGYVENVYDVPGATFIWSDSRNAAEVDELLVHRAWTSGKWLMELLSKGAAVRKVARIENLGNVTGDIVVTNPNLLPKQELEAIKTYDRGKIIYLSHENDGNDYSSVQNPTGFGFQFPLHFVEVDDQYVSNAVAQINENLSYITDYNAECQVIEVKTSPTTSRFFVDNEEFYYTRPMVKTRRKIKSAEALNKGRGFRIDIVGDGFSSLVPLRGVTIIDVTFCEE